jgi:hypothetical protein
VNWLWQNKEWLFSGIGVAVAGGLFWRFRRLLFPSPPPSNTSIQSAAIVANGPVNASPVANGSNISQSVNSPTVNLTIPPGPPTASDWPDVLLQCEWPTISGSPSSVAGVSIPGAFITRNRPWSLRHPGDGVIYNVKVHDIDFAGYRACFDVVDTLTEETEHITAQIFETANNQIVSARDLESLIAHPPPSCDASRYATADSLVANIPVSVTYSDKNGNKYMVKYVLHYDCWSEKGRLVRVGGIGKLS